MGCNCGGGTKAKLGFEVEVSNSGGKRVTRYATAAEAIAAANSSGGTAYRTDGNGDRTRL